MESHNRIQNEERKWEIRHSFTIAEAIARNMVSVMFDKKPKPVQPWDYYKGFEQEKQKYEEQVQQIEWEEYKERRREYIKEFNRRRSG